MLNVTAVGAQGAGYLTVFPCGTPPPTGLQRQLLDRRQPSPNAVSPRSAPAAPSASTPSPKQTSSSTSTATSPTPGATFGWLVVPARLLESRTGPGATTASTTSSRDRRSPTVRFDHRTTSHRTRWRPRQRGCGNVERHRRRRPQGAGFSRSFHAAHHHRWPPASTTSPAPTVPNAVLTKIGTSGTVCIYTLAPTDLVIDVNGYFPNGATFGSLVPARLLESRPQGRHHRPPVRGIGVRPTGRFDHPRTTSHRTRSGPRQRGCGNVERHRRRRPGCGVSHGLTRSGRTRARIDARNSPAVMPSQRQTMTWSSRAWMASTGHANARARPR